MSRPIKGDPCEFCGSLDYEISATVIACCNCGVVYARCDGAWRLDVTTVPRRPPRELRGTDGKIVVSARFGAMFAERLELLLETLRGHWLEHLAIGGAVATATATGEGDSE